ncbi:MAG: prephenate dehydrogenase [Caldilineaceae bacterium]|nr:prephenate dehydrogenase [Caldilineaceae bacterium]
MANPTIAIIGLGLTGTSFGLGLQREPGNFQIVGHDKNPDASAAAKKAGAIDQSTFRLHATYEGADLVVVAVPLSELEELLGHLSEGLQPDVLLLIVSNMLAPAMEIAERQLPDTVHFVVGHPIVAGVGGSLSPRADFFVNATFCLAPSVHTDPDAVQLASDFAERLGAKTFFVDAQEHDGMMAGLEQLPQVIAASLMHIFASSASWEETRRLAGRSFAQATELGNSAEQIYAGFMANRAALSLRIDQLQRELQRWQTLLAAEPDDEESAHPLLTELKQVVNTREAWVIQAELQQWDTDSGLDTLDDQPGFMRQMLMGDMFRRKTREE